MSKATLKCNEIENVYHITGNRMLSGRTCIHKYIILLSLVRRTINSVSLNAGPQSYLRQNIKILSPDTGHPQDIIRLMNYYYSEAFNFSL